MQADLRYQFDIARFGAPECAGIIAAPYEQLSRRPPSSGTGALGPTLGLWLNARRSVQHTKAAALELCAERPELSRVGFFEPPCLFLN
jgi:hypothetical protein